MIKFPEVFDDKIIFKKISQLNNGLITKSLTVWIKHLLLFAALTLHHAPYIIEKGF